MLSKPGPRRMLRLKSVRNLQQQQLSQYFSKMLVPVYNLGLERKHIPY